METFYTVAGHVLAWGLVGMLLVVFGVALAGWSIAQLFKNP